jgi:endonuclease/exonuclease/phosphatase family metal-dependent hydrolase
MKIMQINIWMGRMAQGLMRYIEDEQPDVICMQEVFNADFEVMRPDRMFDILSRLKGLSGLEYEYFSPTYSLDIAGGTAPYGNAILSRFPFEKAETIQIEHSTLEHVTAANYQHNVNNLQIVTLVKENRTWTIANNHGHHELEPLGNGESVAAMQRIAEVLRMVDGPLVFCGDLNVVAESLAMRAFDGWMDDIVTHSGAKTTLARLNVDRDVVCDHILVNDSVSVKSFKVDDVIVSDHYPLVAELEAN